MFPGCHTYERVFTKNFSCETMRGSCEYYFSIFVVQELCRVVLQACENGRGAVLLSVARGKVSEGIDFGVFWSNCRIADTLVLV